MNNELYHHGIQGQKWGVRRFQNSDGTYTAAGKRRYFGTTNKEKRAIKNYEIAKSEYKQAKKEYSKDFDKAYNKAVAGYSPFKKHREANDERWEKAANSAEKANQAKQKFKQAKSELKAEKKAYKNEIKEEKKQEKYEQLLAEGKNLSKNAVSQFGIKASAAGLMASNHMGNKAIKGAIHDYLESRAATWVSKSGKTEIPLSKISDKVMTAGELFTDAYIYGKARQRSQALELYENRKSGEYKERFEKYKSRSWRKDV